MSETEGFRIMPPVPTACVDFLRIPEGERALVIRPMHGGWHLIHVHMCTGVHADRYERSEEVVTDPDLLREKLEEYVG